MIFKHPGWEVELNRKQIGSPIADPEKLKLSYTYCCSMANGNPKSLELLEKTWICGPDQTVGCSTGGSGM